MCSRGIEVSAVRFPTIPSKSAPCHYGRRYAAEPRPGRVGNAGNLPIAESSGAACTAEQWDRERLVAKGTELIGRVTGLVKRSRSDEKLVHSCRRSGRLGSEERK